MRTSVGFGIPHDGMREPAQLVNQPRGIPHHGVGRRPHPPGEIAFNLWPRRRGAWVGSDICLPGLHSIPGHRCQSRAQVLRLARYPKQP